MSEFSKRYDKLNAGQQKAVDTIDGPVMVVAGPGTGKTELLSVRVANILHNTDTLPSSILCLTFTDSGAVAMRERLAGLLGPEAYKVAIHTFHSFGSEVINQNGEYFYSGAHFRPADELSSYELVTDLMKQLPHDNPLASTMNGEFTHLRDIQTSISELKRGGLTPDELSEVLVRNDAFCAWVQPKLQQTFGGRLSKKTFPLVETLLNTLETYTAEPLELIGYTPLHGLIQHSLQTALDESISENSTKPLSAWKRTYLEKNIHGEMTLKDEKRSKKLHALSRVYFDYLIAMQEHELYDYDDMILRVVHAMEQFPELRFNLQERYQYVLVDEFQDTNDAQMRVVWNLTNNPVHEGRPNLMVVGDDDQAIYRFQGANMSNILDFTHRYREVTIVTLTDNYRSQPDILALARSVIVQGEERLETAIPEIDKTLTPHRTTHSPRVISQQYETTSEAHHALAQTILKDIREQPTLTRAVIARNHRQLVALLPHLERARIPLRYEHQENVFDSEPVQQLELLVRVVHALGHDSFDDAQAALSQLLAHPAWEIPATELWQLSLDAAKSKKFWLEVMLEREGALRKIAEWLIVASQRAKHEPLEYMLDHLLGATEPQLPDEPTSDDVASPLYAYFFGGVARNGVSAQYLAYLSALQTIRRGLREYRPGTTLKLCDFVAFVDLHHELGLSLRATNTIETDQQTLQLLSAHKAKGLEFDAVYLVDAHEQVWGVSARGRGRLLQFPSNLSLSPAGDSSDERLRLLYVALTRARDQLTLTSARYDAAGKELLMAGSLQSDLLRTTTEAPLSIPEAIDSLQTDWRTRLLDIPATDQAHLLTPLLERYKLSATHLTNFLDVSRGGPELFLLHNLLRFPQAMSPSATFGSAIHTALQRAHQHLSATGQRKPTEDILHDFETVLQEFQLTENDTVHLLERGSAALSTFLTNRYDSFTPQQLVEQTFGTQTVRVGTATLTGAIDLIDIDHDEKTIFVTDYKTGKAASRWQGSTDYEKIKLHHYEQQLMFYKLLIEHSRQFSGYTVTGARLEFVEPDARGETVLLDYTYDSEKLARFEKLVQAVWGKILSLQLSLPENYEQSYTGILAFEETLLS